jgi:hypothetical protein
LIRQRFAHSLVILRRTDYSQIMAIPTLDDITADWLGKLLQSHGYQVDVAGVSAIPIGTGQVGATYRLTLDYDYAAADAPKTLIAKLPSVDPLSRATGKSHLTYWRESRFYQQLASTRTLPIPAHLFIDFDGETHDFALIMHDHILHRAGNQIAIPSWDDACLSMDALGAIHAAWWGDPMLDTLDWLNGSKAVPPQIASDALYTMFWPAFCARYPHEITPEIDKVGNAFVGRIKAWSEARGGPRCLVHNDFRADNMLYRINDPVKPVAVVDWQTVGVGHPASDLAYYIGTSFDPDTRREFQDRLFARYCDGLRKGGVADSETQGLWDDVCRAAFAGFLMGVTASMVVQQTPRGDAMFMSMIERSAAMVLEYSDLALPA